MMKSIFLLTTKLINKKFNSRLSGKIMILDANNYAKNKEKKLIDKDVKLKVEVEGILGVSYSDKKPSDDYLYDIYLCDSKLEKKNITTDNDEVIVFGKITKSSIRIPLVGGGTYCPDFMYVIKRDDDIKEINFVIETKDYKTEDKIPSNQRFEINCAREFFNRLQEDNYNVQYKVQLKATQMLDIIKNLSRQ